MHYIFRVGFAMLLLIVLLALTGCGPTAKMVKDDAIIADISGLELDESQAPTLVYRRPGAPTLAAYNRFIIDPVQIHYNDPKMKELDPEKLAEMQKYFQTAMIEELREAGYEVGTRSQANTMRVSLTISGLKARSGGGAANVAAIAVSSARGVPGVISVSVGEVTVEGVFRESLTNRIDGVAVERTRGSRLFNDSPWSTWADVRSTFDNWAKGFRKAVDEAHGR